jgi:hypothetical protein
MLDPHTAKKSEDSAPCVQLTARDKEIARIYFEQRNPYRLFDKLRPLAQIMEFRKASRKVDL